MNKRQNDRAQAMAVKNSSQVAKKVYAQFQACVDACEGPECVQECEAEWNMGNSPPRLLSVPVREPPTLRVCLIICCIELLLGLRDCFIDVRTYR